MLVHAALHILGRKGYELLINQGIEKAHYFADLIADTEDFELVSHSQLNILNYRYCPPCLKDSLAEPGATGQKARQLLDELTIYIQKTQRERGNAFVSRTRLEDMKNQREPIVVFRCVLANPLTTQEHLLQILEEQRAIANEPAARELARRILEDEI